MAPPKTHIATLNAVPPIRGGTFYNKTSYNKFHLRSLFKDKDFMGRITPTIFF